MVKVFYDAFDKERSVPKQPTSASMRMPIPGICNIKVSVMCSQAASSSGEKIIVKVFYDFFDKVRPVPEQPISASISGLHVLCIINEPTAAAIAYSRLTAWCRRQSSTCGSSHP